MSLLHTVTLALSPVAYEKMCDCALADFPNETCGFFYGHEIFDRRVVTLARPVNNVKEGDKSRRFEISPQDYMQAERFALQHNLKLLGIYHSHPNHPSIPSEHDLRQAQLFFSYVIVSVSQDKVNSIQSWILDEETQQFIEQPITFFA